MRISMVSEHASPLAVVGGHDAGGQNVHVAELAAALVRLGHDVVVHTRRDDPSLTDVVAARGGYIVDHVDAGPPEHVSKDDLLPFMPAFGRALAARWAAHRPDVVHAHFWMSGVASLIGAADAGVPVVQTFHALGTVKRRHQGAADTSPPGRLELEARVGRDVDLVVATCADEVRELVAMGVNPRRIEVVPCGVDLATFTPDGPALPRGPRARLVTIGRLVERKGIDTVIEALAAVPGAELLVAGGPDVEGLDEDGDVARLHAAAQDHGVSDRVELLGRVLREDVPALLRSADAVVTVPWYEPFGIVPVEAMACGVPVVGSAVGGLLDTVVDGSTGLLVPPRRPDLLAQALRQLLADRGRLARMGAVAAARTHEMYGWDRVAESTARHYRRLVARRVVDLRRTSAAVGP